MRYSTSAPSSTSAEYSKIRGRDAVDVVVAEDQHRARASRRGPERALDGAIDAAHQERVVEVVERGLEELLRPIERADAAMRTSA